MLYVYKLKDQNQFTTEGYVSTEKPLSSEQRSLFRTLLVNAKAYSGSNTQAVKRAINEFNEACPMAGMQAHDPNIQATIEF